MQKKACEEQEEVNKKNLDTVPKALWNSHLQLYTVWQISEDDVMFKLQMIPTHSRQKVPKFAA